MPRLKGSTDLWPELVKNIGIKLADDVCHEINQLAPALRTPDHPYSAQGLLEAVVKELEARI